VRQLSAVPPDGNFRALFVVTAEFLDPVVAASLK
jgi:hypothetical protein